jgi:hypothetical protein
MQMVDSLQDGLAMMVGASKRDNNDSVQFVKLIGMVITVDVV